MDVLEKRSNDIMTMEISGRVDHFCSGILEQELTTVIHTGLFKILIDLSRCDFLSADALRSFIYANKRSQEHGGYVVLCNPSLAIMPLLDFVKAKKVIHIFINEQIHTNDLVHNVDMLSRFV